MPRVVHFEIHASEPERVLPFYESLSNWKFTKWEGPWEYWLIVTGSESPGIDGGLVKRRGPPPVQGQPVRPHRGMNSAAIGRLCCAAAVLVACDAPRAPSLELSFVPVAGNASLPFSAAVRVGDMLYLSGQIGTDSTGKLVAGGIGPETRQTMENIRAVVERNGSSMDRVVKCLVMLGDMGEWGAMNQVYVTYFPSHLPARSAMGASGLALGARVEIECLAALSAR